MGIAAPDNFVAGTLARRAFVEEKSGPQFLHIALPFIWLGDRYHQKSHLDSWNRTLKFFKKRLR